MKYIIQGIVLVGLMAFAFPILASNTTAAAAQAKGAQNNVKKVSFFFIMSAGEGTIQKTSTGGYELLLKKVDRDTLWVTERPARHAGNMNTKYLVKIWKKSFQKVPPNAVLIFADTAKKMVQPGVPVVLSKPKNISADSIVFTIRPLQKNIPVGNLGKMRIFIDDDPGVEALEFDGTCADGTAFSSLWNALVNCNGPQ